MGGSEPVLHCERSEAIQRAKPQRRFKGKHGAPLGADHASVAEGWIASLRSQ
jgi:hypothetical protein